MIRGAVGVDGWCPVVGCQSCLSESFGFLGVGEATATLRKQHDDWLLLLLVSPRLPDRCIIIR